MCNEPLHIINKTSHYYRGIDKFWNDVPCGHCDSCVQTLKNEWFVRSYAEFVANQERGGLTCFITLTYRNSHLPRFRKFGFDSDCPCFYKQDIDTFVKNLHRELKKAFGYSNGLRYLLCCEYGTKYKRPHYHLLLYLPHYPFYIEKGKLKEIFRAAWSHGFVLFSKESKGGIIIRNDKGIRYVSKYVAKDVSYYGLEEVKQIMEKYSYLKDFPVDSPERKRYKLFKQLLPRHYQSKFFGFEVLKRCFVDELDDDGNFILAKDYDTALRKGYRIPMTTNVYKIPRYVLNRLCYDTDKEGQRYLSKLGRVLLKELLFIRIEDDSVRYNHDATSIGIGGYLPNDSRVLHEVFHAAPSRTEFDNVFNLSAYITSLMAGRTFYDLAMYAYIFKDVSRENLQNDIAYYRWSENPTLDEIYEIAQWIFDTKYELDDHWRDCPKPNHYLTLNRVKEQSVSLYNNLEVFNNFDIVLAMFQTMRSYAATHRSKARTIKESRVANLRDHINSFNQIYYVS